MNEMIFHTGGDWPSTTLMNNGVEVSAVQLFVEIRAGRDEFGNIERGGIYDGTDATALVRPQESPDDPVDILPGRLTMEFPGHTIVLENFDPMMDLEATHLWYNGEDITSRVVDLYVDVNAADDVVSAYVTVLKPHWIRADEVITYTIV